MILLTAWSYLYVENNVFHNQLTPLRKWEQERSAQVKKTLLVTVLRGTC